MEHLTGLRVRKELPIVEDVVVTPVFPLDDRERQRLCALHTHYTALHATLSRSSTQKHCWVAFMHREERALT